MRGVQIESEIDLKWVRKSNRNTKSCPPNLHKDHFPDLQSGISLIGCIELAITGIIVLIALPGFKENVF